ncbi:MULTISPECIES: LysR family transcriptional regulator [Phyllobacteriaceae]|uniref:LysR family transcriptional regulator n=1 Tax=Phyllobacterium phragmitis TaxID=2670329 RepID=A0ABQ0H1E9_9HYPH|nr:LysR family transcriptional regulator [Mesorhizobium sp. RMAD-H1]MBB2971373.1 DNA-binding transcriptional LysR family regulator [Mesorhizobium sp. RMAD-H1]
MKGFNFGQLETFARVAECGSFSAAAERLGVSQPAVSLQVRQLERQLGVKLLERIGRKASPTRAGQEFIEHVRRIDAVVMDAGRAMAKYRAGHVGRVRLGTGATACIYLLPPILRKLRDNYPQLDIIVRTGNTPDILRGVEENTIDVALVTLPVTGRIFQATPLIEDEQVAIFPVGEAPPEKAVEAATLAARPLVLYEPGGHSRDVIDGWFRNAGLAPKPVMELGSVEAIKELVGAGLGCAVLPRLAVGGNGSRNDFVVRSLRPRLTRQLGLAMRNDKILDAGLRAVVDAIAAMKGSG